MFHCFIKTCASIGVVVSLHIALTALRMLFLFARPSELPRYLHSERRSSQNGGAWALVTGASDGIGYGFAKELAARGFNVILHGRNESKLNRCKSSLEKQNPTRSFRIAVIDTTDTEALPKIGKLATTIEQEDIKLTVLINNVGGSGGIKVWVPLTERTPEDIDALIDMNARFTVQLSRALLPILCKNRPCLILNVGSFVGEFPSPYLTVYAGSKAFVLSWSRSLKVEMAAEGYRGDEVEVLGIQVGPVGDTEGQGGAVRGFEVFTPPFRRMAKAALDRVGCGQTVVTAYWPHAVLRWVLCVLPTWALERTTIQVGKQEVANDAKRS